MGDDRTYWPTWDQKWMEERHRLALQYIQANCPWILMPTTRKRYHAKAYEAPYKFPRDLMEAIDDMVEAYADTCSETPSDFHGSQEQYDTIRTKIADYIETIGGE